MYHIFINLGITLLFSSEFLQFMMYRLTSAINTAAGTSHHFNKMEIGFTCLYFIQQLLNVTYAR